MINIDEFEPQAKKNKLRDLQPMSVEELEEYIAALQQEIDRADAMIAKKQEHKNGIEALFGVQKD